MSEIVSIAMRSACVHNLGLLLCLLRSPCFDLLPCSIRGMGKTTKAHTSSRLLSTSSCGYPAARRLEWACCARFTKSMCGTLQARCYEEGRSLAPLVPRARLVPRTFLAAPRKAIASDHHLPLADLTDREREVLELVARGINNIAIAKKLRITEKTVRNHVSMVLAKLGIQSRSEAIVRAREAGLGRHTLE